MDMEYIKSIKMQFDPQVFPSYALMRRHRENDVKATTSSEQKSIKQEHKSHKYYQKCKIEGGKHRYVIACFTGVVFYVFTEGYQACQ